MPAQDFLGQTLKMKQQKPMIVTFRSDWETEAADLLATLRADLGEMASRIEHIGSTAIPLMPSKDIIDLQVSVIDLELASRSFDQPLRSLGFQLLSAYFQICSTKYMRTCRSAELQISGSAHLPSD